MVEFGNEKLIKGALTLADVVSSTLGPGGRTVVISDEFGDKVTKDGVTVAKSVKLVDPVEQIGANLLKESSDKTADMAGDGTTTATVLAKAIIENGLQALAYNTNPIVLKNSILKASEIVIESLKEQSVDIKSDFEKLVNIATISSNNDKELGELLASTVQQVGPKGQVCYEDSMTGKTYSEIINGFTIHDRGFIYPSFINTVKNECVLENVRILLTDKKITDPSDISGICDAVVRRKESLLIIATELSAEALGFLVQNKHVLNACVIQCPSYGFSRIHTMEDLSIVTGATFFQETSNPLRRGNIENLGYAKQIVVTKDSTVIMGCPNSGEDRISDLEVLLSSANDQDKPFLENRIANLAGKSATIFVGGATKVEQNERKDRIDDALRAIYSALEEGVVPGGGIAYLKAVESLENAKVDEDMAIGINIIKKAIAAPFKQICDNASYDGSEYLAHVKQKKLGFNAKTGKFEDLFESGVIDPTKVSRVALENAASVATLLLSTKCILYESN